MWNYIIVPFTQSTSHSNGFESFETHQTHVKLPYTTQSTSGSITFKLSKQIEFMWNYGIVLLVLLNSVLQYTAKTTWLFQPQSGYPGCRQTEETVASYESVTLLLKSNCIRGSFPVHLTTTINWKPSWHSWFPHLVTQGAASQLMLQLPSFPVHHTTTIHWKSSWHPWFPHLVTQGAASHVHLTTIIHWKPS